MCNFEMNTSKDKTKLGDYKKLNSNGKIKSGNLKLLERKLSNTRKQQSVDENYEFEECELENFTNSTGIEKNETASSMCDNEQKSCHSESFNSHNQTDLRDPNNWPEHLEVQFLYILIKYRPIGVWSHFSMALMLEEFRSHTGINVTEEVLWNKFKSLYNKIRLDEREPLPFDNSLEDFSLPAELFTTGELNNLQSSTDTAVDFDIKEHYFTVADDEDDDEDNSLHYSIVSTNTAAEYGDDLHHDLERNTPNSEIQMAPEISDETDESSVSTEISNNGGIKGKNSFVSKDHLVEDIGDATILPVNKRRRGRPRKPNRIHEIHQQAVESDVTE